MIRDVGWEMLRILGRGAKLLLRLGSGQIYHQDIRKALEEKTLQGRTKGVGGGSI
jgi:hypothetical protein